MKKSLHLALKWKIFHLIFMSQFCILDWQIPFLISTNSETLPLARDYNLFILFIKSCVRDVAMRKKKSWGKLFIIRRGHQESLRDEIVFLKTPSSYLLKKFNHHHQSLYHASNKRWSLKKGEWQPGKRWNGRTSSFNHRYLKWGLMLGLSVIIMTLNLFLLFSSCRVVTTSLRVQHH